MSGPNQHHLMKSLQRDFYALRDGDSIYVYQFERDREPELKLTADVGAEQHFYSDPATDGIETLDDRITQYERKRLARILNTLRSAPAGTVVNRVDAAELVDHLTLRSAHLRYSFAHAGELITTSAIDLFTNDATIAGMLRVAADTDGSLISQTIDRLIVLEPRVADLPIPRHVLERLVRTFLEENRDTLVDGLRASFMPLQAALSSLNEAARAGHNAGLARALGSTPRTERLAAFEWCMERVGPDQLVLPDCVALAQLSSSPDLQPLILADLEEVSTVFVPFGPHRLLVGRKAPDPLPSVSQLNHASALCSHSFFVSAVSTSELREVSRRIGERNRGAIESMVSETLEELRLEIQRPEREPDTSAAAALSVPQERTRKVPRFSMHFHGWADEATAQRIATVVFGIVEALAEVEPMDRLDGITFAADYAGALRGLDRGFKANSELVPREDAVATGVAMAPTVRRDGIVKKHIVMRAEFAWDLVGDDESLRSQAIYVLVSELLHVAHLQLLDEALPGVMLTPLPNRYESVLHAHVEAVAVSYFAARWSARFLPDHVEVLRELAARSLAHAAAAISAQRQVYWGDRDFDALLDVALTSVGDAIMFASQLFGHCDGLEAAPDMGDAYTELLRSFGLEQWAQELHKELRGLWERCGKWGSYQEFLIFNRLLERALWQFKIILWENQGELPVAAFVAE